MTTPHDQNKLVAFVSNNAWSVYNFRLDVIIQLLHQGYEVIVFAPGDEYVEQLIEAGCTFVTNDVTAIVEAAHRSGAVGRRLHPSGLRVLARRGRARPTGSVSGHGKSRRSSRGSAGGGML